MHRKTASLTVQPVLKDIPSSWKNVFCIHAFKEFPAIPSSMSKIYFKISALEDGQ